MTQKIGDNIEATIEGNFIILKIDKTVKGKPSKTGKSKLIASSKGNQEIIGTNGMILGLNLYQK